MGCVAVMLHIHTAPVDPVIIIYMSSYPIDPEQSTQRQINDLGHDVSKYKRDATHFRSPWLDHAIPAGGRTYTRVIVRTVISVLAVYGLYSLIF